MQVWNPAPYAFLHKLMGQVAPKFQFNLFEYEI